MTEEVPRDMEMLQLLSTIGFEGHIPNGLIVHPDRQHLVYSLGSTIIVEDIKSSKQDFLVGHSNNVSCVVVSKSGKYIASGQVNYMGFKADIIIWDFATRSLYCQLALHKVKVEALVFSPNDKFLVSLGGQDDGSVVVWNVKQKEAICGDAAAVPSAGTTVAITFVNNSDEIFVTGGDRTLRVWEIDVQNRKMRPTECNMGQLKRIVNCIQVSEDDNFFYCGTTSGDILKVNMKTCLFSNYGPLKDKFSCGVTALKLLKTGDILIGTGDGTVALVESDKFKRTKMAKVEGEVTSLTLRGPGHQFYVSTNMSQVYKFDHAEFTSELIRTCHYSSVNDIVFPPGCSELFATCSKQDIRVWNTATNKELRRITVPNMTCNAIEFMADGRLIVSAWDDGKIRAFTPETGRLLYTIHDAHNKGVSSIATTSDCSRIITGGGEGQVRVWKVDNVKKPCMLAAMKEHKGTVTCIKINKCDTECISASTDGTCIIWDIVRFVRNQMVMANTLFKCVSFRPDECQIITSGTDRKVAYWELYDGSQIRELEGSLSGAINGMDISVSGEYFVTGGDDKLIKVWLYNEGEVTHVGTGHSSPITRLKICPNMKYIVSVGSDGAILRYRFPHLKF